MKNSTAHLDTLKFELGPCLARILPGHEISSAYLHKEGETIVMIIELRASPKATMITRRVSNKPYSGPERRKK